MTDLSDYSPKDVERVKVWVEMVADVIEVDPERNPDILRTATTNLGQKAQTLYPQLELGAPVQMFPADLGPWPLPNDLAQVFLELTGDLLFCGEDGPLATAAALNRTIDRVIETLNEKRQEGDAQ